MADPVPDQVGALVGWRTWWVTTDGALYSRCVWPDDGPLTARCGVCDCYECGDVEDHVSPGVGCVCGIHAVRDPLGLVGQPGAYQWPRVAAGEAVAGQVALWGKVVEYDRGWRAEFARPVALALPPEPSEFVLRAQERYALPSVDDGGLYAAMRGYEHGPRWTPVDLQPYRDQVSQAMADLASQAFLPPAEIEELAEAGRRAGEAGAAARGMFAGKPSRDNPAKPAKPSYTAMNPNDPASGRRRPPRRL